MIGGWNDWWMNGWIGWFAASEWMKGMIGGWND
jgi:hypothetical protein